MVKQYSSLGRFQSKEKKEIFEECVGGSPSGLVKVMLLQVGQTLAVHEQLIVLASDGPHPPSFVKLGH